jgi:hypothetical protein
MANKPDADDEVFTSYDDVIADMFPTAEAIGLPADLDCAWDTTGEEPARDLDAETRARVSALVASGAR